MLLRRKPARVARVDTGGNGCGPQVPALRPLGDPVLGSATFAIDLRVQMLGHKKFLQRPKLVVGNLAAFVDQTSGNQLAAHLFIGEVVSYIPDGSTASV